MNICQVFFFFFINSFLTGNYYVFNNDLSLIYSYLPDSKFNITVLANTSSLNIKTEKASFNREEKCVKSAGP